MIITTIVVAIGVVSVPQNEDFEDMRPEARAIALALHERPAGTTLDEALEVTGLLSAKPLLPAVGDAPATIRVWRRRVDGSASSCSGRVDVIPFENYVKGVLPHEWFPSWDPKALEMGAICVRTFAWFWVKAGGKYDCADLDDTTASQVYTDGTDARTDVAVDRTRGIAIVRNGSLVAAEYSAENGSPTKFGAVEPYCAGKEVFGHGRGTCQWGTQRWATNEGKTYAWMVPHYYPDATVHDPGAPPVPAWRADVADLVFPAELRSGQEARVSIELENTGASPWDATVRLGTTGPRDRASLFFKSGAWVDATRPVVIGVVAPGARTRVEFPIVAPDVTSAKLFEERFELVREGTWFGEASPISLAVRVSPRSASPDGGVAGLDEGDPTGGCRTGGGKGTPGGLALILLALVIRTAGRTTRRRG